MSYIWDPKYIREEQKKSSKERITAQEWNLLLNRIITQGDHTAVAVHKIINTDDVNVGHVYVDSLGTVLARTKKIQFQSAVMVVDTLNDVTIITGSLGPEGPVGPAGPQGSIGPVGPSGNDFVILGMYGSLGLLVGAHPAGVAGNAYSVGTAASNTIYVWSTSGSAWIDIGSIQGPQGIQGGQGIPGNQGIQGERGLPGDVSALNAHLADAVSHVTGAERISWNAKSNLALGDLITNAYRGDRGVMAYNHSQATHQAIVTGAATTIVTTNLAADYVLVSTAGGKVAVSAIPVWQLNNLFNVGSDIQAQLNGKLGSGSQAADSLKINGQKLSVGISAPAGPAFGDLWVDAN